MLFTIADIEDGAVFQSTGPLAQADVPEGELASQMPSCMRAGCEGK